MIFAALLNAFALLMLGGAMLFIPPSIIDEPLAGINLLAYPIFAMNLLLFLLHTRRQQ